MPLCILTLLTLVLVAGIIAIIGVVNPGIQEPHMTTTLAAAGWTWHPTPETLHAVPQCSADDVISQPCDPADPSASGCLHMPTPAPHFNPHTRQCDCSTFFGNMTHSSTGVPWGTPSQPMEDTYNRCHSNVPSIEESVIFTSPTPAAAPRVTFVTAYVSVGRQDEDQCKYLRRFAQWAQVEMNLVIFATPEVLQVMEGVRERFGLQNRTVAHAILDYPSLPFGELLPRMYENVLKMAWLNAINGFATGTPEHLSPEYGLINHAKVGYLRKAILDNTFGSDFFFWVDAGAGHEDISFRSPWCPCTAATIQDSILMAVPQEERLTLATHTEERYFSGEGAFHEHWEAPVGGMWGGSAGAILSYYELYHAILNRLTDRGYVDDDQVLNAMAYNSHPGYIRVIEDGFYPYNDFC